MSTTDLHSTSQLAIRLWTGRDARYAQADGTNGRPRRNSLGSSYSHTVLGTAAPAAVVSDHKMACDACAQVRVAPPLAVRYPASIPHSRLSIPQPILGVRYQCANCPSYPKSVSLVRTIYCCSLSAHPWLYG